jgi:DNA modification methylase
MKPEASVKNRNGGFMQHRKPLGYKPNAVTEYLMVYRKQSNQLIDWNMRQYDEGTIEASKVTGQYESSNVWKIDPTFDKVHSAVFPSSLCERVIQYYSFAGDLVYDPFGGSGTMGRVAKRWNRYFLLTEQNPDYIQRMRQTLGTDGLFDTKPVRFYSFHEYQEISQSCNTKNYSGGITW